MRSLSWLPVVALALGACTPSPKRQPAVVWYPAAQAQPSPYSMPFAIPAGSGTAPPVAASASSVPAAPAASAPAAVPATTPAVRTEPASVSACLAEGGTEAECRKAIGEMASAGASVDRAYEVYKRACALKAKLYGCGAFKSTAVSEADRPLVGSLALCEGGAHEACEDVKTKSAPLQAWLSTLKTNACKQGAQALCPNPKECKGKSQWGCEATASGDKVCGCVPKCDGAVTATVGSARTWSDGSKRGAFVCGKP